MPDNRTPWPFRERWRIEGCLMTEGPLHIGSGGITTHPDLKDGDEPVEIGDCIRDAEGLPVLPATSLKGALHAWLEGRAEKAETCLGRVFGLDSVRDNPGCGGDANFHDAHLCMGRTGQMPLTHWDAKRHSWIEVINSIDRERGVAAENHLAHHATVPAGVGFQVVISGRFTKPDQDIPLLLAALEGFNDRCDPVRLGSDTGSGKGRMRWELEAIYRMDAAGVAAWVADNDRGMAHRSLAVIGPECRAELLKKARDVVSCKGNPRRRIGIELRFDGPFLVNDPPTEREKDAPLENRPPNARPRTDEMGRVLLPAKSFRGVLRTQAERVLRTMLDLDDDRWLEAELQSEIHRRVACRPEIPELACKPVKEPNEVPERLCLACQLFGAPGWRSPLRISDFTLVEGDYESITQEMLAVDRFTGGGKHGAKYNALAIVSPKLTGTIEVEEWRLKRQPWALGLLALVLRDLKEGDLAFGWGAAGKGYGRCEADIPIWRDEEFRDEANKSWEIFVNAIKVQKKVIEKARREASKSKGSSAEAKPEAGQSGYE